MNLIQIQSQLTVAHQTAGGLARGGGSGNQREDLQSLAVTVENIAKAVLDLTNELARER